MVRKFVIMESTTDSGSAASTSQEKDDASSADKSAQSPSGPIEISSGGAGGESKDEISSINAYSTARTTAARASSSTTSSSACSQHQAAAPPPEWESQPGRPGYMDLADALAYKAKYGIEGLPRCWGPGLLGNAEVYCNTVYRGKLGEVMKYAKETVAQGGAGRCPSDSLVEIVVEDENIMEADLLSKCERSFEKVLKAAIRQCLDIRAPGKAPKEEAGFKPVQVFKYLPEIIPLSDKAERVYIGETGDEDKYWDDNPAMKGQASLRVKPGCELAAGEFIGVYSGEAWFYWDFPTLYKPKGTDKWDDKEHPSPYPYGSHRVHDFDRYACDDLIIHHEAFSKLFRDSNRLEQQDERYFNEDPDHACKVAITAARLGCPVAVVNDPRRNLEALTVEDAQFREGGPNATVLAVRLYGILPLFVMFAIKPIKARQHVTYDYMCDYWQLHAEHEAMCREVEEAVRGARAAAEEEMQALREEVARLKADLSSTPQKQAESTSQGDSSTTPARSKLPPANGAAADAFSATTVPRKHTESRVASNW